MFTEHDLAWFNVTETVAERSPHYKSKLGCYITTKSKIYGIAYATNVEKSHPLQKEYNIKYRKFKDDSCHHYLHAEFNAILPWLRDNKKLDGKVIYIARIDKKGNTKMARPCAACMAAIKKVGIKDIYYTTNEGYAYERIN